jgi:toxin ParE1/3/4
MKVIWTREALTDLGDIATCYTTNASPLIAEAVGQRFAEVIERVRLAPFSAPRVARRPKSVPQRSFATHFEYFTASMAT